MRLVADNGVAAIPASVRYIRRMTDRRGRRQFCGIVVLSLLAAALEFLMVAGIVLFFRVLVQPAHKPLLPGLIADAWQLPAIAGALFAVSIARAVMRYRLIVLRNRLMGRWASILLRRLLARQLAQPWSDAGNRDNAQIATLMTEDLRATFRQVLGPALLIATDLSVVVFLVAGMLWYNPVLALLLVCVFVASNRISHWVERRITGPRGGSTAPRDAFPDVLALTATALASLKEVQVMRRVPGFKAKMRHIAARYRMTLEQDNVRGTLATSGNESALFLALAAATLYATLWGRSGAQILPTLALFGSSGWRLLPLLGRVGHAIAEIHQHMGSAQAALVAVEPQRQGGKRRTLVPTGEGFRDRIELCALQFGHAPGKPLGPPINVTIRRGSRIAITGPSGVGKTTFVDTLLGLIPPLGGTIMCDGQPLPPWTGIPYWGRSVGYVPQEPLISNETLRDNILFGSPWTGDAPLWDVLAVVGLDAVVAKLPDGLDTRMGERGLRLSGGQRQRLCLARALLDAPAIVVLDEGTAQIDITGERRLFQSILAARPDLTLLIVTHRRDTVELCDDRIVITGWPGRA